MVAREDIWPVAEHQISPERAAAIEAMEAYLFPERSDEEGADRLGVRTDGGLNIHPGELRQYRYARG